MPSCSPAPLDIYGTQDLSIQVDMKAGGMQTLKCYPNKRNRSWRWTLGTGLSHETKDGKAASLHGWLQKHKGYFSETGYQEVLSALAILRLGPSPDPPGPSSQPVFQAAPALLPLPRAPHILLCSLPLPCLRRAARLLAHLLTSPMLPLSSSLPSSPSSRPTSVHSSDCQARMFTIHNCLSQREAALLLVFLAPRWLWPAPRRIGTAPLPAHARPHLIHSRARLVTSGDWDALLDLLLHPETAPRVSTLKPQCPDVLTPDTAKGLLHAAQQHRLSTFWRRLHSYGLLLRPRPRSFAIHIEKTGWTHDPPQMALPLDSSYPVNPNLTN